MFNGISHNIGIAYKRGGEGDGGLLERGRLTWIRRIGAVITGRSIHVECVGAIAGQPELLAVAGVRRIDCPAGDGAGSIFPFPGT